MLYSEKLAWHFRTAPQRTCWYWKGYILLIFPSSCDGTHVPLLPQRNQSAMTYMQWLVTQWMREMVL